MSHELLYWSNSIRRPMNENENQYLKNMVFRMPNVWCRWYGTWQSSCEQLISHWECACFYVLYNIITAHPTSFVYFRWIETSVPPLNAFYSVCCWLRVFSDKIRNNSYRSWILYVWRRCIHNLKCCLFFAICDGLSVVTSIFVPNTHMNVYGDNGVSLLRLSFRVTNKNKRFLW